MPSKPPSQQKGRAGRTGGARRWLAALAALAVLALLGAGVWLMLDGDEQPAAGTAGVQAATQTSPQFFGQVAGQPAAPLPGERASRRQQLVEYYELTDHTYCSYREGSMYPASSQPMSRNPDQAYPNRPVLESNPMRGEDRGSNPNILIQTSQSRVFVAAGESVAFSLRAVEPNGAAVPLVVTRAIAAGVVLTGARATTQVPLVFADNGSGSSSAVLTPGQTGLASFAGTIRTEVRYTAGGKNGVLIFDVIHSPKVPAVWMGQPREAMEDGSLVFVLRADVRTPGRYVVTGRVDDAQGRPFALATFNEVLGPGPNDVKLTVFGKLMHDGGAALPLTLRDVDGYLLKENTDPDRELMPRLEGRLLTSRKGSLEGVSQAEWDSEERQRHLNEFARDRKAAAAELAKFDPSQPLPPSACGPVQ